MYVELTSAALGVRRAKTSSTEAACLVCAACQAAVGR